MTARKAARIDDLTVRHEVGPRAREGHLEQRARGHAARDRRQQIEGEMQLALQREKTRAGGSQQRENRRAPYARDVTREILDPRRAERITASFGERNISS